jgi:hypothetical protein
MLDVRKCYIVFKLRERLLRSKIVYKTIIKTNLVTPELEQNVLMLIIEHVVVLFVLLLIFAIIL